ncbi:hypothetical protein Glove_230g196 [Diversispora epigaea]|uniref:Uncharacterized protein n=1 Tax=Diversispora epigaea TaxID=1348612 RepID=A0A397ICN1_9GLOM|nr:hypothetical protein Glove_230g196 [Diversispora epigaea]
MENKYSNENETINIKEEEFRQYLKSTERGDSDAQLNLGYYKEKAFRWLLKSFEGGEKFGQNSVEYFYRNEISLVKKNNKNNAKMDIYMFKPK